MIRNGQIYTDVLDVNCYWDRYPDVKADGKYNTYPGAAYHWLHFGQIEGRIPGCLIGPAPAGTPDSPPLPVSVDHDLVQTIPGQYLILLPAGSDQLPVDTAHPIDTTPVEGDPGQAPATTTGSGIMDFIKKNPLIVAAAVGLVIYMVRKKKRKKRA